MINNRVLIVSLLLIIAIITLRYLSNVEKIAPNKSFESFPLKIGEWQGKKMRFDEKIYTVLGVDDSLLCNYKNPNGEIIQLYVGFYQSQKEGDIIHSPRNCMPGAGWQIIKEGLVEIEDLPKKGDKIKVIQLILQKEGEKQMVLYWFHSRGRIIFSEYWQKIYLVIDSIFKHRTDGSFVRLITPIPKQKNDETLALMKVFVKQIFPELNTYIPN